MEHMAARGQLPAAIVTEQLAGAHPDTQQVHGSAVLSPRPAASSAEVAPDVRHSLPYDLVIGNLSSSPPAVRLPGFFHAVAAAQRDPERPATSEQTVVVDDEGCRPRVLQYLFVWQRVWMELITYRLLRRPWTEGGHHMLSPVTAERTRAGSTVGPCMWSILFGASAARRSLRSCSHTPRKWALGEIRASGCGAGRWGGQGPCPPQRPAPSRTTFRKMPRCNL